MQSTTHGSSRDQGRMGQPGIMPVSNSTSDDDSGLHDLKALASSTKQRRSQRLSSQMEAQTSLLQSGASLDAVALPDPDKAQPVSLATVAIADVPALGATADTATASASLSSIGTPPTSGSKFLVLGGLAVLAAGAVAFYVMRGAGGDSGSNDSASAASVAVAPSAVGLEDEASEPTAVAPEVVALAVEDEASAEDEIAAVTEDGSEEEAREELSTDELIEAADPEKSEKSEKSEKNTKSDKNSKSNKSDKSEKSAARQEAKAKRELAKAEKKAAKAEAAKAAAKEAKSEGKAPTLGKGGASLDDVLSSVTGGVDKPIVVEKDDKPSKKNLGRSDVSKAMKAITKAAKSCYSAEEFSGTVMVKYSVAPSGKMTKTTALGAHKSSKTGKCIVRAVKRAKFPAFSGATQSFTFPFLLSP